jgi:hypothetical protein
MGLGDGLKKQQAPKKDANSKAVDEFIEGAAERQGIMPKLDPDASPTKSFTFPLNEYELKQLQDLSDETDISMRKLARRLIVKGLVNKDY